jgi:hypothetical protein
LDESRTWLKKSKTKNQNGKKHVIVKAQIDQIKGQIKSLTVKGPSEQIKNHGPRWKLHWTLRLMIEFGRSEIPWNKKFERQLQVQLKAIGRKLTKVKIFKS